MDTGQLLTLLLGGGAVATIGAFFNGIKSLKEGTRSRERDTIKELIEQRREAWRDRDEAFDAREDMADERDYWRNWAGHLEYLLRGKGEAPPERPPLPTKEK